jgi:uncharacterized protein YjiS (DUF1127 family)
MHNELHSDAAPVRSYDASLGRIARTRPGLAAGRGTPANEDHFKGCGDPARGAAPEEATAWSRRAQGASGFGETVTDFGTPLRLTVERIHAAARVRRSRLIAAAAIKVYRLARARLSRLVAEFRRYREERSTYLALSQVDSRTLRDIGIDRSEIRSIAIEIAGGHPTTRIRVHRAIASRNS